MPETKRLKKNEYLARQLVEHAAEFESLARQTAESFSISPLDLAQIARMSLLKYSKDIAFNSAEHRQRFFNSVLRNKAINMVTESHSKKRIPSSKRERSHDLELPSRTDNSGHTDLEELISLLPLKDQRIIRLYIEYESKTKVAQILHPGKYATYKSAKVHGGKMVNSAGERLKKLIDAQHRPRRKLPRRHA